MQIPLPTHGIREGVHYNNWNTRLNFTVFVFPDFTPIYPVVFASQIKKELGEL